MLPGDEICAEYEWLVSNGMSPVMACEVLHKSLPAMSKMLYRYGFVERSGELDRERRLNESCARDRQVA
jgi:hypothetical protein